ERAARTFCSNCPRLRMALAAAAANQAPASHRVYRPSRKTVQATSRTEKTKNFRICGNPAARCPESSHEVTVNPKNAHSGALTGGKSSRASEAMSAIRARPRKIWQIAIDSTTAAAEISMDHVAA